MHQHTREKKIVENIKMFLPQKLTVDNVVCKETYFEKKNIFKDGTGKDNFKYFTLQR